MDKLFVAGHKGMVGSAVCRLNTEYRLLTVDKKQLDLRNQSDVDLFIRNNRPDRIIVCAAVVGGIHANMTYPAQFLYDNLVIQSNIINSAYTNGVRKLIFLGSSCIYPKFAPQPIPEDALLSSQLEPTNEGYALAKIAGLKLCQYYKKQYGVDYTSVMPCNLYGPNDNYHPDNSHVIPGLFHKFHKAKLDNLKQFQIWGSGKAKREFMYVDDLAKICLSFLNISNLPDWINIGTDQELTILELAKKIAKVVGYEGDILTGDSSLDGTPRKKLDCSLLKTIISFRETLLDEALPLCYKDFLKSNI